MAAELAHLPLQAWLPQVMMIARETGEEILHYYNGDRDYEVMEKHDSTPLTEADLAANGVVVESLSLLSPTIPILTEESDIPAFETRQSWETYWLVDPLDGTLEFLHRNGEFTVNIALIHRHEPVLGVIYAPVDDTSYYASRGHGAYKQVENNRSQAITCRGLDPEHFTIASSRSYASPEVQAFITKLGDHELIIKGSSLKSCLVAEGRADLYPRLGPTSEWDTAAAQCIVEEAGGGITDTQMRPLRYNTKDSLLNPQFFVFGRDSKDWSEFL